MRKHISQMNPTEVAFAHGFIRAHAAKAHSAVFHFTDRATERKFTLEDARHALACGKVIEIHNERKEWRALVRDRKGACVVLSLDTFSVVTIYYNAPEDGHETLNHALYAGGKQIDIVEVIKGLVKKST
jgi:hypothetical protein